MVIGALVVAFGIAVVNNTSTAATSQSNVPSPVVGPILKASVQSKPVNPEQLAAFISAAISAVGSSENVSALIVDDATGDVLFSQHSDRAMIPASTLKLLTAVGVLNELSLDQRFTTSVVQEGQTLTLVGGGDPTLVSQTPQNWRGKPPGVEQPPSLDQLADLVAAKLVGATQPFVVNVDSSYFSSEVKAESWPASYIGEGYVSPVSGLTVDFGVDDLNRAYKDPALFAGDYLARALTARGIQSFVGAEVKASTTATQVAQVQSATLVDIVERMVTTSNNTMVEFLTHHVGKKNGDDSFAGSAQVITAAITRAGVDTSQMELHDGSGLSGSNKVTAQTIVDAIRIAHTSDAVEWPLISGLPIAGVSGTLEERFAETDSGRGFVRAKTGTLTGVVSLAGTVTTASGNVLDFAIMANGVASTSATEKDVDSLIKRLSECGCS